MLDILHGPEHVVAHGKIGAPAVPQAQELGDGAVALQGVLLHLPGEVGVFRRRHVEVGPLVQGGEDLVHDGGVGGLGQGAVEGLVRLHKGDEALRAVLAQARLHGGALALLQGHELLQLLVRCVLRHHLHGFGLQDQADLVPVQQQLALVLGIGKAKGVGLAARGLGDKGAHAPADHQHPVGHQGLDGLPQGGAADAQLPGQAPLVRDAVTGLEAMLFKDQVPQLGRHLLGEWRR